MIRRFMEVELDVISEEFGKKGIEKRWNNALIFA
jgi:hypothetical protein